MQLLDAPRFVFHEFKVIFNKVSPHRKAPQGTEDPGNAPLFDSGLSSIGNWILDLVVIAMIALVAGAVLKWAYLTIFNK
jgi:hypothetical protein